MGVPFWGVSAIYLVYFLEKPLIYLQIYVLFIKSQFNILTCLQFPLVQMWLFSLEDTFSDFIKFSFGIL